MYARGLAARPGVPDDVRASLAITHLGAMKSLCARKPELATFAAKQAISLLRHTKSIPVDRAFYEAGRLAKVRVRSPHCRRGVTAAASTLPPLPPPFPTRC